MVVTTVTKLHLTLFIMVLSKKINKKIYFLSFPLQSFLRFSDPNIQRVAWTVTVMERRQACRSRESVSAVGRQTGNCTNARTRFLTTSLPCREGRGHITVRRAPLLFAPRSLVLSSLWILLPGWWQSHPAWMPRVRWSWPVDISHHLGSKPTNKEIVM